MDKVSEEKCDKYLNSFKLNYSINSFKDFLKNQITNNDVFSICILDIQNFKYYNYKFGYEYGNKIIKTVFKKVHNAIKKSGNIYRLGGDVFLLLFNNMNAHEDIYIVINRIKVEFENLINVEGENIKIIVNIGISMYPKDSKDIFNIFKYAEIALNFCKRNRNETIEFFDYSMYKKLIDNLELEEDLFNAIKNKQFTLFYQPQIDFKNSNVYGIEALIRWNHPNKGILPPSYFIDVLEQNGLITQIGEYVIEEACKDLYKIHKLGYSNLTLSLNISEKQLKDAYFIPIINDVMQRTKINPKHINIEITERMFLTPTQNILDILSELRNMGMKILIDDFGTKYSSLNYLYCLPIDGIKIDKSFIDRIHETKKDLIIVKNIVNLAQELNLEVIAEGVECNEQLMKLANINCTKFQGFFYEKPVSAEKLILFLEKFYK